MAKKKTKKKSEKRQECESKAHEKDVDTRVNDLADKLTSVIVGELATAAKVSAYAIERSVSVLGMITAKLKDIEEK